ncbi:MAG: TIGR01906 family membrane protein [Streptococcaceae bacterium]|jgi:integral membrane protein (TIGR01906 family)|nr:TIGR01906 family membrane protein [Streptococcaceae bacterium]
MKAKLHFSLTIVWSIATSASLTILLAIPLFLSLIDVLKLPQLTDLSRQTIHDNFDVLMAYLLKPWVSTLKLPDFSSSAGGLKHFADVKQLFLLAFVVMVLLAIPAYRLIQKGIYRQFYQGLKICLLIPLIILGIALFGGFEPIFISFHQLFFRDTTWLFDPATDPVINILPETYFMLCFIIFGLLYVAFWLVLLVKSKRYFGGQRRLN